MIFVPYSWNAWLRVSDFLISFIFASRVSIFLEKTHRWRLDWGLVIVRWLCWLSGVIRRIFDACLLRRVSH